MIDGGYILQPRLFDKSEASHLSPVTRELWFYLLRNVNHKDNGQFMRGQGFFSFADIQNDLCWYVGYRKKTYSKPQITKALRRLCEGNMTATAKATRGIVITICNYGYYQDPKNYEGNGEGSTKELRRKWSGITINKNDKNERIEEVDKYQKTTAAMREKIENLLPRIESIYDFEYEKWVIYREGKKPVIDLNLNLMNWMQRAFEKMPTEKQPENISDNLRRMSEYQGPEL